MPTMRLDCPRCRHVLEYSQVAPRFCSNCGSPVSIAEVPTIVTPPFNAAEAPTTPPVPPDSQATVIFAPDRPEPAHPAAVGGYRLLRLLGSGGMGSVFEAEEVTTARRVALKLIRPDFATSAETVERFRREGRLASSLVHPRCVFVIAADEADGSPYIVMELMPGSNLIDRVDKAGPLPVREAIASILDVIEGLQEAHRLGLIHRDVKPSNCFLDAEGRVKVGDFGLAKSLIGADQLTRSGAFLGTVLYASPEQIRNEALSPQSDLYSVCATLYYLLTGRAPFHDADAAAALARTVTDPPPSMRVYRKDLPRTLDEVVLQGLAKTPRQRWQSLEELRLALLPFLEGTDTTADLGWRASAYVVDLLLLVPLVLGLQEVVKRLVPGSDGSLTLYFVGLAVSLAWFALPEWYFGCSLGKYAMRLRVRDFDTGDRPSLPYALLRTGSFFLFKDGLRLYGMFKLLALSALLSQDDGLGLPARVGLTLILVAVLPFVSSGVGLAILAATMRKANGYRGLHELISRTRTLRLPQERPRFKASAAAWPTAATLPADVPPRLGGFAVLGVARETADERVLHGTDPVLNRPVWLWQKREAIPTLPQARREVRRAARPHWLAGGYADGWSWDAFVASPGCPLADLVTKKQRLGWVDALGILEQLTVELHEAERDGTLPGRLSPEQVWVQASGRVLLLDAPPREPTPAATPMDLLRQVAAVALEGRPRAAGRLGEPIHAPIPAHASVLLTRLMGERAAYTGLGELRETLRQAHDRPVEISRPNRALQLGLTLAAHLPGLLMMFALGPALLLLAYLFCLGGTVTGELALMELDGAVMPAEEWHTRHEAIEGQLAALDQDRVAVLASLSWFVREGLKDFEKRYAEANATAAQEFLRSEDSDDLLAGPSAFAAEVIQHGWLAEAVLFWPVVWAVWAAVTRGGWVMHFAGIALVGADGRPAARWRCGLRALLVWLPVAGLLLAALWLDLHRIAWARQGWSAEEVTFSGWLAWYLWWGALLTLGAGLFVALTWPNRGLQDHVAGVYPVPS